jgi:hypothetical protein
VDRTLLGAHQEEVLRQLREIEAATTRKAHEVRIFLIHVGARLRNAHSIV